MDPPSAVVEAVASGRGTLVNAERADLLRFEYVAIPVTFGVDLLERMEAEDLPPDWRAWPHPASTQAIGVRWFDAQRSVVLEVPSAVVPHERNYLINPLHPRFREVQVGVAEPFPVDPRLRGE